MEDPIRFYVNEALRVPGMSHIPLLYPFWGVVQKGTQPFITNALTKYQYDSRYYQKVSDPKEAEFYVIPHDYFRIKEKQPDALRRMIEEANALQLPILIDASGDAAGNVEVPNSIVLRINQYRFEAPKHEVKIPVICEDLLEEYQEGKLALRTKSELPVVGFTGWGRLSLKQRIRTFIKELPVRIWSVFDSKQGMKVKGVFWRERAIKIFNQSKRITTNFLIRNSYSGHAATVGGDFRKNRLEFVHNILDSDYTLIIRGDANEATRFYETLSLGRIPVLIDTAVVLPLEDRINYNECCVIIPAMELHRGADILADFHQSLTNEEFQDMQKKARAVFREYLRYDVYSRHLALLLRQRLSAV